MIFGGILAGVVVGLLLDAFFGLMDSRSQTAIPARNFKLKGPYNDDGGLETLTFYCPPE
jgi:hypothetical protein